jgi:hypothetical protein
MTPPGRDPMDRHHQRMNRTPDGGGGKSSPPLWLLPFLMICSSGPIAWILIDGRALMISIVLVLLAASTWFLYDREQRRSSRS